MLSHPERPPQLSHSKSESILSRSAAQSLLEGLSTPHASAYHLNAAASSSQHPYTSYASTSFADRPPRPPRSPPVIHRRVTSNPAPLPTTLPTASRVVPLIPGLGYHLAQRRAAEEASSSNPLPSLSGRGHNNALVLSSPSSNYSGDTSDSDDCPPTEEDRPDSVAPTPEVHPWQESDNYCSPVWASRWSRRGSEASGTGTAGGRGDTGEAGMGRRPSFSTFSAARRRDSVGSNGGWAGPSSSGMGRRISSTSSVASYPRRDSYLPPSFSRSRSGSNASAFPNFPFPFPGGGRRGSKVSLLDSMNGPGNVSSSSTKRRDSSISIRYLEDGDGWENQPDLDSGAFSRRSSYDSSFAFDHGRRPSVCYSPNMSRKPSLEAYAFGTLPPPRASSASSFYRRQNSSQGSLRDLPRPPSRSHAINSRRSSVTGGAGQLNFMGRRESWQSQVGLMISGGRAMERRLSVDSVGEMERIRRLGGMRELNRRESEVLERRGSFAYSAYSDAQNPWEVQMNHNAFSHMQSHWSPSSQEGGANEASSPELADSTDSSSPDSPPMSPISNLQDLRSRYLEPFGNYKKQHKAEAFPSPPNVLSPLPNLTPISLSFSFGSGSNPSQSPSHHSSTRSDQSPPQQAISPGEMITSMLADQVRSDGGSTDWDSELEDHESTGDVEITMVRRSAMSLSPVHFYSGSEFPKSTSQTSPLDLAPRRPGHQTLPSGTSDLAYLAESIRLVSESTEDILSSLPPFDLSASAPDTPLPSHLATSPPGLLPPLPIQRALRNPQSMSALKVEQGARKYDRLAAFETKDPSLEWTSSFTLQEPTSPSAIKTSYFDPSESSNCEELLLRRQGDGSDDERFRLHANDITPRPSRRRPNAAPQTLLSTSGRLVPATASSSSSSPWEYPWSGPARQSVVEKTKPPMQQQQQKTARRDLGSSSSSANSRTSLQPISSPPILFDTKCSAQSLPFERAFVQRTKEGRKQQARSLSGTSHVSTISSFAHSHTSSASSSSNASPCTGTAIHPESGLCYCGAAYLSSARRMSKPNPRLVAPHLPPPHLRATPAAQMVLAEETRERDLSRIRFSMPPTKAEPVVLPPIATRAIPLPAHHNQQATLPATGTSGGGKAKAVLSRLFAGHRKTASSGTF